MYAGGIQRLTHGNSVVQTVLYGAHWSVPLLAGEGAGEGADEGEGEGEGRDEGVGSVHAAVHLLDAVRLNSRNSLRTEPCHCSYSKTLLDKGRGCITGARISCFHVKMHVSM